MFKSELISNSRFHQVDMSREKVLVEIQMECQDTCVDYTH